MYLEVYVRSMIKQHYAINTLQMTPHEITENDKTIKYMSSHYHFEMDYTNAHNSLIKQIVQNRNITGRKHIFVLKKFTSCNRQYQLKTLVENENAIFIIITKTISNLDTGISSRSTILRKNFTEVKTKEFLQRHYGIEEYDKNRSLISVIADVKTPRYEVELNKLLDVISKSRTQMDIVNDIKAYCYKVFHVCIPLHVLCKCILKRFQKHAKIADIMSHCAKCDLDMNLGTKDILCYEQLFVGIYMILKEKI